MKYLLNTLFIAVFFVTVGCSNELTSFDENIIPISSPETVLSTGTATTGLNNTSNSLLSADGKTVKDNNLLIGNEPQVVVTGEDDDTLPPPMGG